jgi:amino acid transporter
MKIKTSSPMIELISSIVAVGIVSVYCLIPSSILFFIISHQEERFYRLDVFLKIWGVITFLCSFIRTDDKTIDIQLHK